MNIFRLCKPYLLNYRRRLAIYIGIILATSVITIVSPYILGDFLDTLIYGANMTSVFVFCAIFGGINVLRIGLGYVTGIIYVRIQSKMGYDLNMDTIKHVQQLSLSYATNQDSAYLNQRINADANNLVIFCITILQNMLSNVIMLVVPLVILLRMNWFVAILLLVFLVVYVLLFVLFREPIYRAGYAMKESQGKFFARLQEQLKYIEEIKINSAQPEVNKRADNSFTGLMGALVRNQRVSYLYSGLDGMISMVAQVALFVIGGLQVLQGNFTIGMFTIFSSYFGMMMGASRYFFNLGANYQNVKVSYDRVKEILDMPQEPNGAEKLNRIEAIRLSNVSFSYGKSQTKVLDGLNVHFTKGKIYGILGGNGTGKSTLIKLIFGMYQNEFQGSITYNEHSISHVDMFDTRRRHMALARQEPVLFGGSIWYNIYYNDTEPETLTPEQKNHLNTLGMTDFIFQNGWHINETGADLSGGEKQKAAILKVLCKNTSVMVFDEPTSALDAKTARDFVSCLQEIKHDKIIIVVTHDGWVADQCDKIIKIKKID